MSVVLEEASGREKKICESVQGRPGGGGGDCSLVQGLARWRCVFVEAADSFFASSFPCRVTACDRGDSLVWVGLDWQDVSVVLEEDSGREKKT